MRYNTKNHIAVQLMFEVLSGENWSVRFYYKDVIALAYFFVGNMKDSLIFSCPRVPNT